MKIENYFVRQREIDEMYMRRCLQLARLGWQGAPPNPMVGAVLVCDGRIIGEGYHRRCGEAHAEVNAINSVRQPELISHSTIYVSLEPCAHYGKTPPCAQLIIDRKIPRVVVGCQDPFARVDGRGITMLRDAGIDVTVGVLEEECLWLNRRFITFHTMGRPYITLKWAQSKDGFIDSERNNSTIPPVTFSTSTTQALVHQLRAENESIVVGHRTWELDKPSLTVRHWHGRNPLRFVIGHTIKGETRGINSDVKWVKSPEALVKELAESGVQTLLVEGGAQTLQSFIDAGLWDEARIETAIFNLNEGVKAPRIEGREGEKLLIDGNSIRFIYKIS